MFFKQHLLNSSALIKLKFIKLGLFRSGRANVHLMRQNGGQTMVPLVHARAIAQTLAKINRKALQAKLLDGLRSNLMG